MKIGVISLGCCKNLVDSENLIGLLKSSGLEMVAKPSMADAIIINTCGFIEPAKKEAIDTILEMAEYKEKNCKHLIVMGCLAQRYKEELIKELPEVDCFIGLDDYDKMGTILSKELGMSIANTYGKTPRVLSGKPWSAYLKIADGCDNRCSYCAIPLIRGPYRSFAKEDLIEEAKTLANKGVKELNIIAQDTTRYGTDNYHQHCLKDLLSELNKIEDLKWIRVLYMYPDEIDDELLETMSKLDKVLPYFDVPMQHASNHMLELMNRRGSEEELEVIIKKIRKIFAKPTLRTTMIVGFPQESDNDFEELLASLKRNQWDRLGAFEYSPEEDTPGYSMDGQIDDEVKASRKQQLMALQETIMQKQSETRVGAIEEVLLENYDALRKIYHARSKYDAPDGIDGEVLIKTDNEYELGTFIKVKIIDAKGPVVYGEEVSE